MRKQDVRHNMRPSIQLPSVSGVDYAIRRGAQAPATTRK